MHWYPQSASSSLWILKKTSLIFNLFQTEITSLDFLFWPKTWGAVLSDDTITRCFAFYCAAGAKCSLSTCFCKWKVTKSNFFFSSLIAFSAISYENVTHRNLMLLLALPHLPCGYTLPANWLLVKSNDELPLVIAMCSRSCIFPVTSTRSLAVIFQATKRER